MTDMIDAPPADIVTTSPVILEPAVVSVGGEEVFDFTSPKKNIKFKIDDDVFDAIRELPGLTGLEFASFATTMESSSNLQEQADVVEKMFRLVLQPTSADLFIERLRSPENPIGVNQMNQVMTWLMSQYGLRPTVPSEESADGS